MWKSILLGDPLFSDFNSLQPRSLTLAAFEAVEATPTGFLGLQIFLMKISVRWWE
jgi:hypothetical protein